MKIVIFAPHPDDEVMGCGGSILKWLEDGHDAHVVYVTDNRVLVSWGMRENTVINDCIEDYINLNEDEIAEIALKEADEAARAFGFPDNNVHFLKIHDQDAMNKIDLCVRLVKDIIKDADKLVLPGDINNHPDHKATHIMAKNAAKSLNLNAEFYVYYSVSPKEKQVKIKVRNYRERLYDIMGLYKTQLCIKETNAAWGTLRRRVFETFGVFHLEDMGKFKNF